MPKASIFRRITKRVVYALAAAAFGAFALATPAKAQANVEETYTFLVTVAVKGQECELLRPWEAATILAETERFLSRAATDDPAAIAAAANARIVETTCDDEAMLEWIGGAQPGIETEWLPPNLALVRALALQDDPPAIFLDSAVDLDLAVAVAEIDALFAAFEAGGVTAEGAESWSSYAESMEEIATTLSAAINGENDFFTANEAQAFIVEATLITGMWLDDTQQE